MPSLMKNVKFGTPEDPQRWIAGRKLGEGQFAEVYAVRESYAKSGDEKYAVKMEKRRDSKTVRSEYKVLKKLASGASRQVCFVVESGLWFEQFFIIMELLGMNLAEAKRMRQPDARFEPHHVCSIGLSTLAAVQSVHDAGFVHRDVKPANFALHPSTPEVTTGRWYIIDFGLARRYLDGNGHILAARSDASFRGSTTYASINAHHHHDLSRRDDLWSWFYILVELLDGNLPWRGVDPESRESVVRHKLHCIQYPQDLTRNVTLPDCLRRISQYLYALSFEQEPDYQYLRSCVERLTCEPVYHKARGPPLPSVSPREEITLSPEDRAELEGEPITSNGHDPRFTHHSRGVTDNGTGHGNGASCHICHSSSGSQLASLPLTDPSHQAGPGPGSTALDPESWHARTSQRFPSSLSYESYPLPRPRSSSGRVENGDVHNTYRLDRYQRPEQEYLTQAGAADSRKRPRRESPDIQFEDTQQWRNRIMGTTVVHLEPESFTDYGLHIDTRGNLKAQDGQRMSSSSGWDIDKDGNQLRQPRNSKEQDRLQSHTKPSDKDSIGDLLTSKRDLDHRTDILHRHSKVHNTQHVDVQGVGVERAPSEPAPAPSTDPAASKVLDQAGLSPAHGEAVQRVNDYLSFFSQGASSEARQVLDGFSRLEPVDALACIAILLKGAANSSAVNTLPQMAGLLEDLGTYTFHVAHQARERHARHKKGSPNADAKQ